MNRREPDIGVGKGNFGFPCVGVRKLYKMRRQEELLRKIGG